MDAFRALVYKCHLKDLGYEGVPYTWFNKRGPQDSISERLDRCLANRKWCNLFPYASVIHGTVAHSSHILIILHLNGGSHRRRGKKPFRFEAMWVETEDYEKIIAKSWKEDTMNADLETLMDKIDSCSKSLIA
ncbi:hypothetical protein F2P56_033883 [Juglans regia]|uniref:Uncharacterized protein n=2 Tax=Juglans regia TaxID=51240 RepID=A0A833TT50_JUGRE|nr:uncharacterized protein LOC109008804 [Juglans regia]KAF5444778.1 hypothetical protein F2P56_033883 [Juglans regia]